MVRNYMVLRIIPFRRIEGFSEEEETQIERRGVAILPLWQNVPIDSKDSRNQRIESSEHDNDVLTAGSSCCSAGC